MIGRIFKKTLLFFAFFCFFIVLSCNQNNLVNDIPDSPIENEDSQSGSGKDDEKKQGQQADPDSPYKSCRISSSNLKDIYFVNDDNGVLTLTVHFLDASGSEIEGEAVWEYSFPEGTQVATSAQTMNIDINSIKVLDDYKVTVSEKTNSFCKNEYIFSVISRDKLANSLSYSLITIPNDFSDLLTIPDGKDYTTNVYDIIECVEYDLTGHKIGSSRDRITMSDETTFNPTGHNAIFINVKDNAYFGELEASFDEDLVDSDIGIIKTTGNGFLVCIDRSNRSVDLNFKAGNKDERKLVINAQVNDSHSLSDPVISGASYAVSSDGLIVSITGDSVTNTSFPVQGGNVLDFTVERRKLNSSGSYTPYNEWKSNEESCEIPSGQRLHLKHAGDYKVTARMSDAVFSSQEIVAYFTVYPYTDYTVNDVLYISGITGGDVINSENRWGSRFTNGLDHGSPGVREGNANHYTVKLTNHLSKGLLHYILINSSQTDENPLEYIITPNSEREIPIYDVGNYTIKVYYDMLGDGYGSILPDELDDFAKSGSCVMNGCSDVESLDYISYSISGSGEDTVYTVRGANIGGTNAATIYVATYKNSVYEPSLSFTLSSGATKAVYNRDYSEYAFKTYVYFAGNKVSSSVKKFVVSDKPLFRGPATINQQISQDKRNARKVLIQNYVQPNGETSFIYYSWDGVTYYPKNRDKEVYIYLEKSQVGAGGGTKTLYVKTEPYNLRNTTGSQIVTQNITLSKLPAPGLDYEWTSFCHQRLHIYIWPTVSGATCKYDCSQSNLHGTCTSNREVFNKWPGLPNRQYFTLVQYMNGWIDSDSVERYAGK